MLAQLWERLNTVMSWEQGLATVAALRQQETPRYGNNKWSFKHAHAQRRLKQFRIHIIHLDLFLFFFHFLKLTYVYCSMHPYKHADLIADPLLVLKCDKRVFRCPPIFSILLQVRLHAQLLKFAAFIHRYKPRLFCECEHWLRFWVDVRPKRALLVLTFSHGNNHHLKRAHFFSNERFTKGVLLLYPIKCFITTDFERVHDRLSKASVRATGHHPRRQSRGAQRICVCTRRKYEFHIEAYLSLNSNLFSVVFSFFSS